MTTSTSPAPPDVLGGPEPVARTRDWRDVLAAVIGVAAVGVAGTGIAVAVGLSGGGPQPEEVLPADVFAFAKVDLDPSGDQKLAAYELAKRFPDLDVESQDGVKDGLLRELFSGSSVDYDEQVAPWIGARAAVAGAPDGDGDGNPELLIAIAYDDRAAAERLLPGLLTDPEGPTSFAFSQRADYVLLAMSQQVADGAADPEAVLADAGSYVEDLDRLDGDQVAVAWADAGATWAGLGAELQAVLGPAYGPDFAPTGRFVAGVHLEDDLVELRGQSVGLDFGDEALNAYALGAEQGTGLAGDLPSGALAALSLAGLGEQFEGLLGIAGFTGGGLTDEDVAVVEEEFGLRIPDDVVTLFGEEVAAGVYDVGGEPQVGARARTPDPDAALGVAEKAMALGQAIAESEGEPVDAGAVRRTDGGVAYGSAAEVLDRVATEGGLGDTELFRRAVPDAEGAAAVLFADLQPLFALLGMQEEGLAPLESVGMSSTGGADGGYRLRVTFD